MEDGVRNSEEIEDVIGIRFGGASFVVLEETML